MVNEWTRDDFARLNIHTFSGPTDVLDEVVAWLNAHYPKRPEWIGESLLGQARTIAGLQDERDAFADRWKRQVATIATLQGDVRRAERERDEWKARALDAEHYAQAASDSNRDNADRASKAERERDEWQARAEALEAEAEEAFEQGATWQKARTAPAVTKADIEKAIRSEVEAHRWTTLSLSILDDVSVVIGKATDTVWALVSGTDPAVYVVRESDIAAVEVKDGPGWQANCVSIPKFWTAEQARKYAAQTVEEWCGLEAIARAIEAEAGQDEDPLLDKAQEFAALADWELTDREARLLHAVAAHVLGQEVRHVDQ